MPHRGPRMMDWHTPVFNYCERLSVGWLGEPLNASSNLAFLVAAWLAWRRGGHRLLAAELALVGCASLTFHMLATRGTGLLDALSILLFNLTFLVLTLRGPLRAGWPVVALCVAGFLELGPWLQSLPQPDGLQDSTAYLAPLFTLAGLAAALARRAPASARLFLLAGGLFVVSLTLRTLDRPLCGVWPTGLHWLWHLLNALVLWLLMQGLQRASATRGLPGAR